MGKIVDKIPTDKAKPECKIHLFTTEMNYWINKEVADRECYDS